MMKNFLAKLTGLLFLSVFIEAEKLTSENDNFSIFAAKTSPTSEELQIPKYLSFEDLNTLEDIFGSFSDIDLQSYLPPSSVLSDFSAPSPQKAYSASSFQSGHSAPLPQSGHSSPSVQSSYTAVPAVKTDSFAIFDSPKEGKQLGSSFGSFPDSYSSVEVSKSLPSPNALLSNHGHSGGVGGGYDKGKGMPYEFGYAVKDEYTKNDYGHKETSNGDVVTGEYRVLLPDGRTQIVSYTADHVKGYQANVRYEGEAKYPEPSSKHNFGAQHGKQLQQNYNSLGQEKKPAAPYKQFQLPNPLPLENHRRDLPESTYNVPNVQQHNSSPPQPHQTHSLLQPQQGIIQHQPQQSYSPPHQPSQNVAPQKFQIRKYTPLTSQQNHNSSPTKQVVFRSKPQQSYSPPQAQQNFEIPKQTKLQQAFDPPKPQESYTQPILQESYSVPEPRQSLPQPNHAPAQHQQGFIIPQPQQSFNLPQQQQGFIIPQPQQSYSSSDLQQSYVPPEHPNQNFHKPQAQQSYSSSDLQQSYVPPEHPNQSFHKPQAQQTHSSSEAQSSFVIPQPQQRFDLPQPQQSFDLSQPQQSFDLPQPQQSFDLSQPQQSIDLPLPLESFELPQPAQSYEIPQTQFTQTNPSSSDLLNLDAASVALYLPPSQSVQDSTPQLDTSYLPPITSNAGSPHRKRSAASALYRKSSPNVVIKRSQKVPLQFESLKNKKNFKKDSFIR